MNTCRLELLRRTSWAVARIGELVNLGRCAGWLAGAPLEEVVDSESFGSPASDTPMHLLATRFGLTKHEIDLLWLLACVELDPHVSHAAQLLVSPGMSELSAQMVERLLARGATVEVDLFEKLNRLALIEISLDVRLPLYRRAVRVSDRVLDLARGEIGVDRSFRTILTLETASNYVNSIDAVAVPVELQHALRSGAELLVVLTGASGSGRSALLRRAVSLVGRNLMFVRSAELEKQGDLVRQLRAIARECRLHSAESVLLDAEVLAGVSSVVDRELLQHHRGPAFAISNELSAWNVARPVFDFRIEIPDVDRRAALWRRSLPGGTEETVRECARRYAIGPEIIKKAAAASVFHVANDEEIQPAHVHRVLRTNLDRRLAAFAKRVEVTQTWDDLVLPVDQFDLIIELVSRVRHRHQVFESWGFAAKVGRGQGLSALLSGPPGTGKTMVAGLIARELGLDLYQIDLSKIVSKYIGETEKQLAALFDAAESGQAILLFDEADSLFAKRTEVKSSNDRYANLEVNYLLQRIESFTGIALLTTNHETAIDAAFLRRLSFHIRVPMPDESQRELLWQAMIPTEAATASDLDFKTLAREFVMSGGYVKNAVLRAAFFSASEATSISNTHLVRAARAEYEAMGKLSCQVT